MQIRTLGAPGKTSGAFLRLAEAVRARFQSQLTMNEKNERFWGVPMISRKAPGDPRGSQKFIKNHFLQKQKSERDLFVGFCAESRCSRFLHDFPSTFLEKSMNKQ